MKSLREYIAEAQKNKTAIGHFNVSTLDGLWAVVDAAKELDLPVIVGLSEGERDYVGVGAAAAIIQSIREERNQPVFLNADHTYTFDRVKQAIDVGFDSVIFDGAQLSFEENISITKKCVEYARTSEATSEVRPHCGGEASDRRLHLRILVEGELGFIGASSKLLDSIPEGAIVGDASMTKPDVAAQFVRLTGVDLLAPAVGNIHGVVKGGDPALNSLRVKEISEATTIPLVLHGASGNSAADIRECIEAGVSIVHVNTELRMAYRAGLVKSLSDNPDELSPYKYLRPAKLAMQKVIEEKLRIISNV